MNILLTRLWKSDIGITGTFAVDGKQKYFSLELPEEFEGETNVQYKTCILPGTYEVQRLWSNRWNQMMPHVIGTLGRTDVEIHVANNPEDILGCIGIGKVRISDAEIGQSQAAFNEFETEFDAAIAGGETVTITIE